MITLEAVGQRIRDLQAELFMLRTTHDQSVLAYQQTEQKFKEEVEQNQKRFQQLSGAVAELRRLEQTIQKKETNHDNSIPTPDLGDRAFNVCVSEQPEGR
jgi:FPC/CPF motif-containing protein YcgG